MARSVFIFPGHAVQLLGKLSCRAWMDRLDHALVPVVAAAAVEGAACGDGPYRIFKLHIANRHLHDDLLWSRLRLFRERGARGTSGHCVCNLWRAVADRAIVAETFFVWPARVAMAQVDLRQTAAVHQEGIMGAVESTMLELGTLMP